MAPGLVELESRLDAPVEYGPRVDTEYFGESEGICD